MNTHEQAPQLIAHIAIKDAQQDLCEFVHVNDYLQSNLMKCFEPIHVPTWSNMHGNIVKLVVHLLNPLILYDNFVEDHTCHKLFLSQARVGPWKIAKDLVAYQKLVQCINVKLHEPWKVDSLSYLEG
jgi:hypothetical protein